MSSPILQGLIKGAVGGYIGGFTGGFLMTGNLNSANQSGISGLKTGATIGAAGGVAAATLASIKGGYSPFTGKFTERSIRRTYDIPDGWEAEPANKGDGIKFVDKNSKFKDTYYRFMNGNSNGTDWQKGNRIEIKLGSKNYDANGNQLPNAQFEGSHINVDKTPKIFIKKPFYN